MDIHITKYALEQWRKRHGGDQLELITEFNGAKIAKTLPPSIIKDKHYCYYHNERLGCYFVTRQIKIDYVKIVTIIYPGLSDKPVLTHKPKQGSIQLMKRRLAFINEEIGNYKKGSEERAKLAKEQTLLQQELKRRKDGRVKGIPKDDKTAR